MIVVRGIQGGYSYEEKEGLKDSVVKVLRQIGVSDEECEKIVTEI